MSTVKSKQPRRLADESSPSLKNENIPFIFEETYVLREVVDGVCERSGNGDSAIDNVNNLHGYVD